jgi:hypothetical protein
MSFNTKEIEIINFGIENGKSREEVEQALSKYRGIDTVTLGGETPTLDKPAGLLSRIGSRIASAGEKVEEAISGTGQFEGQSSLQRGFQATAAGFNTIGQVGYEVLPETARKGLDWTGEKLGQGFKYLTDKIAGTKLFKEIGELEAQGFLNDETAPELGVVKEALGTLSAGGQISGNILLANQVAKVAQTVANVSKNVASNTISTAKDTAFKVTEALKPKASDTPASIMQRVARVSKGAQAKFEQMAKTSIGDYLTKRNIFGNVETITTKLAERMKKYIGIADDELAKLKGTFSPQPVKTMLKELLEREKLVSTPGAPSKILNELRNYASKNSWTMSEINQIKRLFERNVKLDYLRTQNPTGVARATNLDSAVRQWQLAQAKTLGFKNLDVINKETQLAKNLLDTLGKEYAGSAGNNWMGLSDWVVLSGGDPTAVAAFLIKKGFSNKDVQSWIAKYMNKGKATMENIKAETAPSEVLGLPSPTSGVRSSVTGGATIKVPPRGSNIDVLR